MSKVSVGTNIFLPMPVTIIGTVRNGIENYMAAGWITRVNGTPPLIAIGLQKKHQTSKNIAANKEFSINFPSIADIKRTDYVGIVSGNNKTKSEIFTSTYGKLKYSPLIIDCHLSISCKLFQKIELPSHDLFIGEVVEVYAEDKFLKKNTFLYKEAESFILTMPDNKYWSIGEEKGNAWRDGKDFIKKE